MTNQSRYAGADWLRDLGVELSPLGEEVANLIGDWQYGIYHLNPHPRNANWADPHCIEVSVYHFNFSTFDADNLTRLVFLCHDRLLRCEISVAHFKLLRLTFHKRHNRVGGSFYDRHPTIENALAMHRRHYPEVGQSMEEQYAGSPS